MTPTCIKAGERSKENLRFRVTFILTGSFMKPGPVTKSYFSSMFVK